MEVRRMWSRLLWGVVGLGWAVSGYGQRTIGQDPEVRRAVAQDSVMQQGGEPGRRNGELMWRMGELLEQMEEGRSGGGEEEQGGERDRALAYEYFEQLLEHPLAINRASRRELERLFILSDFQITSLLTYRQEHGDVLSGTELALLSGFNDRIVSVLKHFVTFEEGSGGMARSGNFRRDCRSQLLVKSGVNLERSRQGWGFPPDEFPREEAEEAAGKPVGKPTSVKRGGAVSPVYTYLKYRCDYLDRIRLGFTLENDAGERFLGPWRVPLSDFFSFHAHLKSLRVGKVRAEVILGDFSARFGQGLTLWKAFQLNGAASPAGLYKRGAPVMAYASSDETNFLRGGAVSLGQDFNQGGFVGLRGWEATGFISYRGVDARVEDGKYTSVQTGGLHRPVSGEEGRRAMHETVGGVNAAFIFSRWKLGMSWVVYGYDKANGRRVTEYNRYQMYDGFRGNAAVDFYAVAGPFRFFGELALGFGSGFAGLAGVLCRVGEVELGMLARSYARGYIAPHAGGYSTTSGCSNQRGITVTGLWNSGRAFVLSGNLEFTRYPAPRYLVPYPSSVVSGMVKGEYRQGRWDGYVRFSERFSTDKKLNKLGLKGAVGYQLREALRLGLKGEWVTTGKVEAEAGNGKVCLGDLGGRDGWENASVEIETGKGDMSTERMVRRSSFSGTCSVELGYATPGGSVSLRGGWCWFSVPQWAGRLYGYEAGLPGSYGSVLLYGTGSRGYLTAKVMLFSRCDLSAAGSWSAHKKGGGERELPAPRLRLQLGLKMKF